MRTNIGNYILFEIEDDGPRGRHYELISASGKTVREYEDPPTSGRIMADVLAERQDLREFPLELVPRLKRVANWP